MQINVHQRMYITATMLTCMLIFLSTIVQAQSSDNTKAIVLSVNDKELKWGACPSFMSEGCSVAVLQGNPEQPNADVFFKMQGNTSVPRHWHHSPERMVLISGKLQVEYEGENAKIMKAGNYAYGPAERPHSALCISDEPCILFIAFEDPVDAMPVSGTANSN